MGSTKVHEKVKLVIPILFNNYDTYKLVKDRLISLFGNIDYESEYFLFTFTNYYKDEMGELIYRIFLSFEKLINIEDLVYIKLKTNEIEKEFSTDLKRNINLDPGYMQLGKFVLATTKDQQHRLYISNGIYEEITLFYRDKKWQHWEWTYPDYRSEKYKAILNEIRNIYKKQLEKEDIKRHN